MRKEYVSVEDMGTPRQNPSHSGSPDLAVYDTVPPQAVSRSNWRSPGRTAIADIEYNPPQPDPQPMPQPVPRPMPQPVPYPMPQPVPHPMPHQCLMCSQMYAMHDPLIYYMIIAVLSVVIVLLLVGRNSQSFGT